MQEAAAARARLVCLRNRLGELRGLNIDRQQRAVELQERVAETEVRCTAGCSASGSAHINLASPPVDEAHRDSYYLVELGLLQTRGFGLALGVFDACQTCVLTLSPCRPSVQSWAQSLLHCSHAVSSCQG